MERVTATVLVRPHATGHGIRDTRGNSPLSAGRAEGEAEGGGITGNLTVEFGKKFLPVSSDQKNNQSNAQSDVRMVVTQNDSHSEWLQL